MSPADCLSIQLYSLRDHGTLEDRLDALAGLGFTHVETVGGQLEDAAGLRTALDGRGLKAPTGHVGMADLRTRLDWVAEKARTVGIEHLFMPAVPPEDRTMPAAGWSAVGEELASMAERMTVHGLKLGYHNHHWELEPFADGTTPLQHLLDASAGSPLGWQVDIAWLARGGADPIAWMDRYPGRVVTAHVKDIAPSGQNADEDGWCDVGAGTLDWPTLWKAARVRGATWMVLEHDKPKDAVAFATASRAYVLGLAD